MAIDLTKITTPFGLLDADTKAQLAAAAKAGMQLEYYYSDGDWICKDSDRLFDGSTYRLAPGQVWPKRREVRYAHLLEEGSVFLSRDKFAGARGNEGLKIIARVRVEIVEGHYDD